jgi:hypothetical protein
LVIQCLSWLSAWTTTSTSRLIPVGILPHLVVQLAKIMLACGAEETNTTMAGRMGLTGMIVDK